MSDTVRSVDDIEKWVLGAFQDLGLTVTDVDGDFFEAGGTSLTAIKLIAKVEERFGEDTLPPDDLFATGGVRDVAATIRRNSQARGEGLDV
ncbi:phosphopantetheine-binding protein [Kutzneria sp. 744]|uniref:phosphopantetheine-binding protein n=1 Tax=Kutzneria sp. (strain 744) TaxID=345341 RepID=UPI00015D3A83|nr:phosphopantetheine-binding protein [Kutzneria sp. 744]ABV56583.1 KtzC [Kutzneria sp. 744]EWM18603.1 hypothetical protein KUTG_08907 [Kutzneria sp. 744]